MSQPLLSAALIVRDEEQHLASCLSSLQGLVDEIVIVDTGSVDNTLAIARRFTDNISEIVWQDDFASARNCALDHCHGQWVLYIDADECLRQESFHDLRQQLAKPELVGCYLWLHPTPRHTAYREMRLFRNHAQIRFEGCIHENIWPSLKRYRKANKGRIGHCELVLDHVGYEGDQSHKYQRNLPLLLKKVEQDPEHTFSWWHLGSVYLGLGEIEQAQQAWLLGVEKARSQPMRDWGSALSFISLIDVTLDDPDIADPLLQDALQRYPDHPQLIWLQVRIKMRDQLFTEAIELWLQLKNWLSIAHLSDNYIAVDRSLFDLIPYDGLATCYFRLNQFAKAKHYYQLAEQHGPNKREYVIKQQLCGQLMAKERARNNFAN